MNPIDSTSPDPARRAGLIGAFAAAWCAACGVHAQPGPRGLRILSAAPPGGTPDVMARHYAARLAAFAPAGVVVENRPGAGGLIAVAALRQADPDGATTLLGHTTLVTLYPHVYKQLPYDPQTDLVPVAAAAGTAFALAVGPAVPRTAGTLPEYLRWAAADTNRATFGTIGLGTMPHLLVALLARQTGFAVRHIPYIGGPQAIADLVGGRLGAVVLPEGLLQPLHTAGRLRVLATTGATRNPALPGVPTLAEAGYDLPVQSEWMAFFVPRGTPAARIAALAQAVRVAGESPESGAALAAAGLTAEIGGPEETEARLARDSAYWREAVASTGIRLE